LKRKNPKTFKPQLTSNPLHTQKFRHSPIRALDVKAAAILVLLIAPFPGLGRIFATLSGFSTCNLGS
jgi:hypothetical protein